MRERISDNLVKAMADEVNTKYEEKLQDTTATIVWNGKEYEADFVEVDAESGAITVHHVG